MVAEELVSHLRKSVVGYLEDQISRGFVGDHIEVELFYDGVDVPLRVWVAEFVPSSAQLFRVPVVTDDQPPIFGDHYPFPVAVQGKSLDVLTEKCRDYMETVVRRRSEIPQLHPRSMNNISKRVLHIVSQFYADGEPSAKVSQVFFPIAIARMNFL